MLGWFILAFVGVVACLILHASNRPGHRRRGIDRSYMGPERRQDFTIVDRFDRPVFFVKRCEDCDKLRRYRGCPPEECSINTTEVFQREQK